VVCFKGATFLPSYSRRHRKLFERSLVGLRQATTEFIIGSQAILPVCQVQRQRIGNRPRPMPRGHAIRCSELNRFLTITDG
jgi:hypothetical protein